MLKRATSGAAEHGDPNPNEDQKLEHASLGREPWDLN